MKDDVCNKRLQAAFEHASSEKAEKFAGVQIDLMAYVAHLDGLEGTIDQKLDILRSMASILLGFIDLGFEVVFTEECCGKLPENEAESAQAERSDLDSEGYERGRS